MKGRNERKKGTKGLQERRQRKNEKLEGKDVVKGRKEGGKKDVKKLVTGPEN